MSDPKPNTCCSTGCGKQYDLTPANAVVYVYTYQPWFTWAESICTYCNTTNRQFLGEDFRELIQLFRAHDLGFIIESWADDVTIHTFENLFEVHMAQEHNLTARQERQIAFLAHLLEYQDVMDEFEGWQPQPDLPREWI